MDSKNENGSNLKTTNCNIKFEKADVYCGRGNVGAVPRNIGEKGWLGNPYVIGNTCYRCKQIHKDGGSTLICYEEYLKERLEQPEFVEALKQLKGKKLGCFCKPKPCHTDILIKYIDKL
jgi:hypothetical protein